jgi:hypothetical protein
MEGMSVTEAVIKSCEARTRPIAITALALMGGSMVILDDPIFQGMAVSLIFGGAVSTVLTLLVIPLGCISAKKAFPNCDVACAADFEEEPAVEEFKTPLWMRIYGGIVGLIGWIFVIVPMVFNLLRMLIGMVLPKSDPPPSTPPPATPPSSTPPVSPAPSPAKPAAKEAVTKEVKKAPATAKSTVTKKAVAKKATVKKSVTKKAVAKEPELKTAPVVKETIAETKEIITERESIKEADVKEPESKPVEVKKTTVKKVAKKKATAKAASVKKIAVKKAPSKKSSPGGRRGIRLKDDSDS